MIDYSALLYDPIYDVLGVPATLTAGASEVELTVIDETRPKTETSSGVQASSVGPGVYVRMPEFAAKGIAAGEWDGALLTFNGRSWIVRKGDVLGSPNGEDLGEVRLSLMEASGG